MQIKSYFQSGQFQNRHAAYFRLILGCMLILQVVGQVAAQVLAPTITNAPTSQVVEEGNNASFNVMADGTGPLSYQWTLNGVPINDATWPSLSLTNVQSSQAGPYQVVVSNAAGTVTSSIAELIVITPCNGQSQQPPITKPLDGLQAEFRLDGSDPSLFIQADKAQFVSDRFGRPHSAMQFPGSGITGSLHQDFFKNRTQWSWVGWIRPYNAGSGGEQDIYLEGNYGSSGGIFISNNRLVVATWNEDDIDNWNNIITKPLIRNNIWQFIIVTFDAIDSSKEGDCSVYINGIKVFSDLLYMSKATDLFRLSTHDFYFGGYTLRYSGITSGITYNPFQGVIDDILIYNRALTMEEIKELAHVSNGILSFSGDDGYLAIPSIPAVQNSGAITVEAWVNPAQNTNNANAYFISKGAGPSLNSPKSYELYWSPDNRAYFSLFTGQSTWSLLGSPVAEDQWTHLAATFNSADGWLKLYTNGVLAAATTNDVTGQFPLAGQKLRQTTLPLVLGCSYDGKPVPGSFATGLMDEVRIWDRTLSGQEIQLNLSRRMTGAETNLAGYWNFDNLSPVDKSKNKNDGALMAGAQILARDGYDILHDEIGIAGASFDRRGQIILEIAARNTVTVRIEASTNLVDWIPVGNAVSTGGTAQFIDPDTLASKQRFYRAVYEGFSPSNMVWISPGRFLMGSPENEKDRQNDEGPPTKVVLTRGFWMGKYEVTQRDYVAIMGNNPSTFTGDLNRPVESVTWIEATNYCSKLTELERQAGRIPADYLYRLPTEAEWEYACRAGTRTRFYYGDDPDYADLVQYAWFGGVGGSTHPVGQKSPNAWGLYDLSGNVFEWCWDWYGAYPGGSMTDPQGPSSGSLRIRRGGSWDVSGSWCRPAFRSSDPPDSRHSGFRLVLGPAM